MSEHQLRAWISEALSTIGTAATPLVVSKHVWVRHRADIEAAGDLLYTWQLDLHAAATAMASAGLLEIRDSAWSLPDGVAPRAASPGWTEAKIAVVVEGYVAMLRADGDGPPVSRAAVLADIATRTGRSGSALTAMLSNISAVVQELGLEPLPAYPPRSNVPVGVRPAVRAELGLPSA